MNLSKILCCICCLLSAGEVLGMISNSEEDENKNSSKNPENLNSEDQTEYEVTFVGDTDVGKTQIIKTFVEKKFNAEYTKTIAVEFSSKTFYVKEKASKLQIWDTTGNEMYKSLVLGYVRKHMVFVYDVTNKKSFENIKTWLENVKQIKNDVLPFLVGNKTDLEEDRAVSYENGKNFAEENNMIFLGEVSAFEEDEIDYLFKRIIIKCLNINDLQESDIEVIEKEKNDHISNYFYNINTESTNGNEESCWKNCFRSCCNKLAFCCNKLAFWRNNKEPYEEELIKIPKSETDSQNKENNDNTNKDDNDNTNKDGNNTNKIENIEEEEENEEEEK